MAAILLGVLILVDAKLFLDVLGKLINFFKHKALNVREIEFTEAMSAGILSNHRRIAPFGLEGGGAGEPGRNRLRRASGDVIELGPTASAAVGRGDTLIIETPGGGAFGPPQGRDSEITGDTKDES